MFHLLYKSRAKNFTQAELDELLKKARGNNQFLGVTGMLLYKSGNFLQLIEHEERDIILSLFERICRDPRHEKIVLMAMIETNERFFPDWSMASKQLESIDEKIWEQINIESDGSILVDFNYQDTETKKMKLVNALLEFNFT